MITIDLKYIFNLIIKRWWIILLSAIVFTACAYLISIYLIVPVYKSNTTLYIGRDFINDENLEYNDLLISSQLVEDYRELVKSRLVVNEVLKILDISDLTAEAFSKKLSVELKNNTRIIKISASDDSPETAKLIADKVSDVFIKKAAEIMRVENVKIIDRAEISIAPVKPNIMLNTLTGFIISCVLSFGIIFVAEYFDSSVKTVDEIKEYLNLPVIGMIPHVHQKIKRWH